jgi:threonine/homoserine/homoserine lactone efflux protein
VVVLDFLVLAAFIPASLVIILSPGADTFLLLRYSIKGGRTDGFASMLGILTGLSIMSLFLISGVGLLASKFPLALDVLSMIGIGVLVLLAVLSSKAGIALVRAKQLVSAASANPTLEPVVVLDNPFRMSLITNITNPKVIIFYLAFFPQFLGTATNIPAQLTLLSLAFLIVTVIWLVPLVYAASAARIFFQRPAVAIAMEFSVAGVFAVLAVILALGFSTLSP